MAGMLTMDPSGDPGRKPATPPQELFFTYRNYRGEISRRRILAGQTMSVRFGTSEYHPEPQLLLKAYDMDKEDWREFAVRDIDWRDELTIAEDVFFEESTGTTWTRPTAWAYFAACRAREQYKSRLDVVLDHVDYTNGACRQTEMVGACLPSTLLAQVKSPIAEQG